MEFHYRGVVYDSNPLSTETSESGVVGHYRGASLRFRRAKNVPHDDQGHGRLKYRGAWVR